MKTLTIAPLPFGWSLEIPGDLPTVYRSGSAAETAGRRLAEGLAAAGEPVKLVIRLRDGAIAGRFLFSPPFTRGEPALGWAA